MSTKYSDDLLRFIKSECPVLAYHEGLLQEASLFLENQPVVTLQKNDTFVCYRRPGIEDSLRSAFYRLRIFIDQPEKPVIDTNKHTFFDVINPSPCSKNELDLEHLFATCEKVGLLRELYIEVTQNPNDYFAVQGNKVTFSPLRFSECPCSTGSHSRFLNEQRYKMEMSLCDHICKVVPDRNASIRILDMGCGDLLQVWQAIGRLIEDGYTSFEVALVDPELPIVHKERQKVIKKIISIYESLDEPQKLELTQDSLMQLAQVTIQQTGELFKDLFPNAVEMLEKGQVPVKEIYEFAKGMSRDLWTIMDAFQEFYKTVGVDLKAHFYNKIGDIQNSSFKAHAVLGIDFEPLFQYQRSKVVPCEDMLDSSKFMDKSSMLFLSQQSHGIISTHTRLKSLFTNEICQTLRSDMANALGSSFDGPVKIAVYNQQYWPAIQALAFLRVRGIESIEILCLSGSSIDEKLFTFIDPRADVKIIDGSLKDLLLGQDSVDFVFAHSKNWDELDSLNIEEGQTHSMQKSTSIYFTDHKDISKISLNRNLKLESDVVFI